MNKTKSLLTTLMLVTSMGVLQGCGSKTLPDFVMPEGGLDTTRKIEVKFYSSMGKPLQDVLNIYIDEFNEIYPNITISHTSIGSYDDIRDQMSIELSQGDKRQCDMSYCYPDHVALYLKAKSIVNLDTLMDDPTYGLTKAQKDDFIDVYYNEGNQFGDGHMYCLPFSKSTEVLYYNKTFFDEHELSVPTTWDEMEQVCRQIKTIDPMSIPLGYDSDSNLFITMAEQMNAPYTSATGDHFLFDNPQTRSMVEKLKGWYNDGLMTTKTLYGQYTSSLFTNQTVGEPKAYMSIGSSAGATNQRPDKVNGVYPFEVGISAVPQVSATNKKVISQGPSVCIFKHKDPQVVLASWLFLKHLLTSVPFQGEFSTTSGYVPVINSVFEDPIYKSFLNSADGTDGIAALSAKQCVAQKDMYFSSPAFVGSSTARDEVGGIISSVLSNSKTVDRAFKDAVDECNYKAG